MVNTVGQNTDSSSVLAQMDSLHKAGKAFGLDQVSEVLEEHEPKKPSVNVAELQKGKAQLDKMQQLVRNFYTPGDNPKVDTQREYTEKDVYIALNSTRTLAEAKNQLGLQ